MPQIHGKIKNTFLINLKDFGYQLDDVHDLNNQCFNLVKKETKNSIIKVWICPEELNYKISKLHQIQVEIPTTFLQFFN